MLFYLYLNFFFHSEKKINLDTLEIPNDKKLDDYFSYFWY